MAATPPRAPTPSSDDRGATSSSSTSKDEAAAFVDVEKASALFTLPPLPAAPTPEHFRDIAFLGPITLHRLAVLFWIVGTGVLFFFLQEWIWPDFENRNTRGWPGLPYLGVIWLVSLPTSVATLFGSLWFRYNTRLDRVPRTAHPVAFRIVSRGTNRQCLLETVKRCQDEMRRTPLFPYLIEIVTDGNVFDAPPDPDVIQLKVPIDYTTPNGTLFKARALHYACEHSVVPAHTWLVHLDEETQPTSSGIKGIADMIAHCERVGDLTAIGQGSILYNRAFHTHPFLTLADMRRTGDDFGQFFLQHRLGVTLFGLHGAYIVCRQDAEAAIGFDLGPAGSITEDAWWVLLAMKHGYRTRWVDGYLEEQSTQSLMDLLKQRRRWYYGLSKVITQCPVPFRYRAIMFFTTSTWLIIPLLLPLQLALLVVMFVLQQGAPLWIRILTNFIVSIAMLVYLSGLVANMVEHRMRWWKMPFWTAAMLIVLPLCMGIEVVSVVMAFFAPCSEGGKGFHVVQKSAHMEEEEEEDEEAAMKDQAVEEQAVEVQSVEDKV
ncbi:unnamed protein product [Chondrus crispus]|uniref:Glycosyltransferase 2-like domain-containing protein n=1 Tax=Chondrus crispus TaxID=2769 RepID=R7Q201_CHOCR|nr:unnamed protein product [Chondrus crispus]CDF32612.1 unnamed protein product [Chondrus crispus]|eukprot:XP_005712383.1 unnamed protein product [Chondrus crispus]